MPAAAKRNRWPRQLPPDALADLQHRGIQPTDDAAQVFPPGNPGQGAGRLVRRIGPLGPRGSSDDKEIAVILDKTNFYAEMGGQVGDAGELRRAAGSIFDVITTRIVGGYVLHVGKFARGTLHVGDAVTAIVLGGRERTEKNHTATHMLNWALRQVLGGDVLQKGSLVDPEKLRFDFSHGQAVADEEIAQTQALVNQAIAQKIPVYTGVAPQEKALKINGLRAVFGEKYPAQVRVLSVGVSLQELLADPASAKWRDYSIEFCGGTHLTNTAQIEAFTIVAEESVSKGVRRIVALTGDAARESQRQGDGGRSTRRPGRLRRRCQLPGPAGVAAKSHRRGKRSAQRQASRAGGHRAIAGQTQSPGKSAKGPGFRRQYRCAGCRRCAMARCHAAGPRAIDCRRNPLVRFASRFWRPSIR